MLYLLDSGIAEDGFEALSADSRFKYYLYYFWK
jgi:hypothetical protein